MIARRQLLAGLGAAAVLGFDPRGRTWISSAQASSSRRIPRLDGQLLTDPASLARVSSDVGGIVHDTPVAVLRPGSVRDIAKMVKFCREFEIKVAARGQGHTTFGQSQVAGGLVIEMAPLNQIYSIKRKSAEVGAGVKWNDLLRATAAQGLTPPVFTGYTGLSVGGTLSVGGIPATYQHGVQVEHVRKLEVVTGEGDVVECSADEHSDLFEAVLAGLGQCGIITRAVIELVPAKQAVRQFFLEYTDNAVFFRDFRTLIERGEFDDLYNLWIPDGSGGWLYQLNAIKFYDSDEPPNDARLLRGLHYRGQSAPPQEYAYVDYILRIDALIEYWRSLGLWDNVLHPWFDVILPDRAVEKYVGEVVPSLAPDDVGATGFLLLFAIKRSELSRPLFRVPDGKQKWVWLFDILTAAATPGPDAEFEERMLTRNRVLFEKARDVGATRYPIGSLTFDHADWVRQYGDAWFRFAAAKRRYDPSRILTPGPGIFR
jgi:cytokinin dehydrogenase